MKRVFPLILALTLVLSLVACSNAGSKNNIFDTKPSTTAEPIKETQATTTQPSTPTEAAPTEAATTEASATQTPETEAPATEANELASIRGQVIDGTYVSEVLNLKIDIPANWIVLSDEELAQTYSMSVDLFQETDLSEIINQAGQFFDFSCNNMLGTQNVNVSIQPSNPLMAAYSDADLIAAMEPMYMAQLQAAGMEISTYEPLTMQVNGTERTVLHVVLTCMGVNIDEYQLWCRNNSDYMGIITITVMYDNDPQPILDCISIQD